MSVSQLWLVSGLTMKTIYDIDDEKSKSFNVDIFIKPIGSENASFESTFINTESQVYVTIHHQITTVWQADSNDQWIH